MNNVIISGKLKDDFKVNAVGDKKVAKATLIVDRGMSKDKKDEAKAKGQSTADFPQIEIWGSEAKINFLTTNAKKGDKILVKGSMHTDSYNNKEGKKVYTTSINVSEFEVEFKKVESKEEDYDL